jgi:thymidine kinase
VYIEEETPMTNPVIVIYTGCMYAGKSTALYNAYIKALENNKKVVGIKPSTDNRYGDNVIKTHTMKTIPASVVKSISPYISTEEWKEIDFGADVFLIDEVQFFKSNIVDFVKRLRNVDKEIHIAGLDMDYKGNSFGSMPELMTLANKVIKFEAVCSQCNLLNATMTYRKQEITNDGQILVGGSDIYESRCYNCWKK